MMKYSKKPNFQKMYKLANEILVMSETITDFPYSTIKVINEFGDGVKTFSYSKAKDEYGLDISLFGSDSAILIDISGYNIIFYNEKKPIQHVKYSLLHEFGHLINNHKMNAVDYLRDIQEIETNYFTAQLLMPDQLINEFIRKGVTITKEFLMDKFGVSQTAAEKRLNTLNKFNKAYLSEEEKYYDDIIIFKYKDFIEKNSPTNKNIDWLEEEIENELERENWR